MTSDTVVHLIDDDDAVRHSLAFLLSAAGFAVRVYESATAFLDALPSAQPGCIVTDIRMPELDGLDLQRKLNELGVRLPVIVMTGHADVALAVRAMKAGAVDFLEKPFDDEALIAAVRSAAARRSETAAREAERAGIKASVRALSGREREVFDGVVAGRPNKQIALDLNISPRTVEVYRANVMTKLGVATVADLVRVAIAAEIESPADSNL